MLGFFHTLADTEEWTLTTEPVLKTPYEATIAHVFDQWFVELVLSVAFVHYLKH